MLPRSHLCKYILILSRRCAAGRFFSSKRPELISLQWNGPSLPESIVCRSMLHVSTLYLSRPQGSASRRHYMRPCSNMLGIGKMSIVKKLIGEGRNREWDFWSRSVTYTCTLCWLMVYGTVYCSNFSLISRPSCRRAEGGNGGNPIFNWKWYRAWSQYEFSFVQVL